MIDPFWTSVIVALPPTLASLAACIYAFKSHDQSRKNTKILEEVVEQTNGMSEKLQKAAEDKGFLAGTKQAEKDQAKP